MARRGKNDDRYDDRFDDQYDDSYAGDDGYAGDDTYSEDSYVDDGYADDDNYAGHDAYEGGEYVEDASYEDDPDAYEAGGYDDESYGDEAEDDYDGGADDYYHASRRRGERRERRPMPGRVDDGKKTRRIIIFAIEIVALLVALVVLYMVMNVTKAGKANLSQEDLSTNIAQEVKEEAETGQMKGYRNIALFGVDSTKGELDQNTRSDSIIICSINQDTGDVKLVSVYRDTYLNLGNYSYNKANAAYAKGGPQQAINMLNSNLDMNITDFVTVGFGGLTDVINALGGIELTIEEDEISHLNNYQSTMAKELGMDYTEVTEPGTQVLDGLQATAYCRIRYTRGWDYKRAARQRAVLYAVMDRAKNANPAQLSEIATNVFQEIYTSYDLENLIADISAVASYNLIGEDDINAMQNGFPQADLRIQANLGDAVGDSVVPRSLAQNVQWLHQFLFDDADYQVSPTVQQYSDFIDQDTADAIPEEMTDADHT